jgi:hypothetical protein
MQPTSALDIAQKHAIQFTNGQGTYLVEAWNVYAARQKLEDKDVDPGHYSY